MSDEKEIEVEVEAEQQEAKTEEKPVITAEEGVAELRAKLAASEAARQAAEARARNAEVREVSARGETHESQISLVNNALQATLQKEANLKKSLADAHREGDFDLVAELQTQIADNSNIKMRLQDGKAALEKQPKPTAPPPAAADPVEALASQLTPTSASWVRAHPEFARDTKKYNRMIRAHEVAISEDLESDTPAYFKRVEEILGISKADAVEAKLPGEEPLADSSKATGGRGVQPPPAPVSRSSGGSKTIVRLSQAQRDAAAASGLTEQEYAKNLQKLKAEGRLN